MSQAFHKRAPLARPLPALESVAGVSLGAVAAGIRYQGRKDLMLMSFAPGTVAAGVFTKNACPGAPVLWCRQALARTGRARALLVNSGNANVFTGKAGNDTVIACADAVAASLGCDPGEVFLASTGVIGEILPCQRILDALPELMTRQDADAWEDAARAIMTTDTFPKAVTRRVMIGDVQVCIQGIAKGSGMIAPDMATMLAYIATDATLPQDLLQGLLEEAVAPSFNAITVDSDTSTSDMVMLFATGQKANRPVRSMADPVLQEFRQALREVLLELALLVVRDGEGATKLVCVEVRGAASDQSAKIIARSIANSPLVKTAIAGEDANWGRVVMAVGKSGEPADRDRLSIAIGGVFIARNGAIAPDYDEARMTALMRREEIDILADIGLGTGQARIWTCDLTHGYIDINGSYRS